MNALLNQKEVCALVGLSRNSIHRHRRAGTFPPPVTIGKRTLRWEIAVLEDFIAGKWQGQGGDSAEKANNR